MITKNGICLDLKESKYKIIKYGLIFYFSSLLYKEKFERNVEEYIKEETIKLKNKYLNNVNFEVYLAISYYKKIEKRGFLIIDDIKKKEIKENAVLTNVIIM